MFLLGSAYPTAKLGINASMPPILFGALRMVIVFICLLPFLKINNATILGVGPMSKNCVDAALDLSKESILPIMLISSRRQIDYNSGYVNNWDTKNYSDYIINSKANVILARDHGGPWQSDKDIKENVFRIEEEF